MTKLDKNAALFKLNEDFLQLMTFYKETELTPFEFSDFLLYLVAHRLAQCKPLPQDMMAMIQVAVAKGFFDGLAIKDQKPQGE